MTMERLTLGIFMYFCHYSFGLKNVECGSPQYLKYGERGTITCSFHGNFKGVLWYDSTNTTFDPPIVALSYSTIGGRGYESGAYNIDESSGSLMITNVSLHHERTFSVKKFTSFNTEPRIFFVSVFVIVRPVPGNPVVENCNDPQRCILEVHRKGKLTCSLTGIRPKVKLEWMTSNDGSTKLISFFDNVTTANRSDETFNITLTSSYSALAEARVTVECAVFGSDKDIFPDIKAVVDLLFVADVVVPWGYVVTIVLMGAALCVFLLMIVSLLRKINGSHLSSDGDEESLHSNGTEDAPHSAEGTPMLPSQHSNVPAATEDAPSHSAVGGQSNIGPATKGHQMANVVTRRSDNASHSAVGGQSNIGPTIARKGSHQMDNVESSDPLSQDGDPYAEAVAALQSMEEHTSETKSTERPEKYIRLEPMVSDFVYLSKNIGSEWESLGRNLGLLESEMYGIRSEGYSTREAIYQMLNRWKQMKGPAATYERLQRALREEGRSDLAEDMLLELNRRF